MIQMNLFTKQKQTHRENKLMFTKGEREGGGDKHIHTTIHKINKRQRPTIQYKELNSISSVQSLSHVQLFVTPWTAACQASLSITNSQSLLKLTSIESVMPSNHLILCSPLLLLHAIFPSTRIFSKEIVFHIGWPKYCSFSFTISPSSEYSGLISFRVDWFDLLAVQGTLKSLLQHHSSKALILPHSAFFISNSYIHT